MGNDNEPINLNRRRAEKSGDCRHWTVLDALRATIADIEAGTIAPDAVYIAMRQMAPEQRSKYHYAAAGCTNMELCGLLAIHMSALTDS